MEFFTSPCFGQGISQHVSTFVSITLKKDHYLLTSIPSFNLERKKWWWWVEGDPYY
jgi:hypothetical protein